MPLAFNYARKKTFHGFATFIALLGKEIGIHIKVF
jgi:hypothetical protein